MDYDQLSQLLQNTRFADAKLLELPILETAEKAFSFPISVSDIESTWQEVDALVKAKSMRAIVSTHWFSDEVFDPQQLADEVFSRFYFEEAPAAAEILPRQILQRSQIVDFGYFLDRQLTQQEFYASIDEVIENQLFDSKTFANYDFDKEELKQQNFKHPYDIDRFLLEKELSLQGLGDPKLAQIPLYEPDNAFILILPILSTWEALAYVNWYGTSDFGSEYYIALGKHWEKQYGAELYCHYGTMLQCLVDNPPTDIDAAWQLSRQHDMIAPCTLAPSGVPVRYYANALLNNRYWFLHDRP